jgi:hypothetical protein
MIVKVIEETKIKPFNPSNPSVRFVAFDIPDIKIIPQGMYKSPKSISVFIKGIIILLLNELV